MNVQGGTLEFEGVFNNEQLIAALEQTKKQIQNAGSEIQAQAERVNKSLLEIPPSIKAIGAAVGIGFGITAIKNFVGKVIEVRGAFQDATSSMTVFLGSAEKANKFMNELQNYAYYNTFEFADLTQESAKILAFGNDVENVIPIIDKLSNVAAGTHQPLAEFVDLYNKAKNVGRVDAIGLQSWAAKGVVITDVLKSMGVEVDRTNVTFEQLDMVLNKLTSDGGMFHNLMAAQMQNLSQSAAQLQDDFTIMLNEIGSKMQGVLKGGMDVLHELIANYEKVGKVLFNLIAIMGIYKAALIVNNALLAMEVKTKVASSLVDASGNAIMVEKIVLQQGFGKALAGEIGLIKLKTAAQAIYNRVASMNPYVLMGAALVAVVTAVWAFYDSTTAAEKAQNALNKQMEDAKQKRTDLIGQSDSLVSTIKSETSTVLEQIKAFKELNDKFPGLFKSIDELRSMSDKEIKLRINMAADEQDKTNLEQQIAHIQEWLNGNVELRLAYITDKNSVQKMANELNALLDKIKAENPELKLDGVFTNRLELLTETLKLLKQQQEENKKLVEQAKYENMTMAEKKAYLSQQKWELEQQRDSYAEIVGLQGKTPAEIEKTFTPMEKFNLQMNKNYWYWLAIMGKIDETAGKLNALDKIPAGTSAKEALDDLKAKANEAEKAISAARKKMLAGDKSITKEDLTKLQRDSKEAADNLKALQEAFGIDTNTSTKGTDEKKRNIKELAKLSAEAITAAAEAEIKAMKDGYFKKKAEEQQQHEKNLADIKKRGEELLEARKKVQGANAKLTPEEQAALDRERAAETKRNLTANTTIDDEAFVALSEKYMSVIDKRKAAEIQFNDDMDVLWQKRLETLQSGNIKELEMIDRVIEARREAYNEETKEVPDTDYENLLKDYGSYTEKKKQIEDDFNEKIKKAKEKGNTKLAENLKKELSKNISKLGLETLQNSDLFQNFMQNAKNMTLKQIDETIKKINEQSIEIKPTMSPQEIDELNRYLESLRKQFKGSNNPFNLLVKSFKDFAKEASDENLQALLSSFMNVYDSISNVVNSLKNFVEVSGNAKLQSAMGQISAVAQNLMAAGKGAQSGGWIGAIVGGVTDIISQTIDGWAQLKVQEQEAKVAMQEYHNALKLMEFDITNNDGIFGSTALSDTMDNFKKLQDLTDMYFDEVNKLYQLGDETYKTNNVGLTAVSVLLGSGLPETLGWIGLTRHVSNEFKALQAAYEKGYTDLQAMAIKIKDYNGWQEFWGKEDQYKSLKDLAPELWGADGVFNVEKARKFLETNKQLSDKQRQQIQNYIDMSDKIKELNASVDEYLKSIYGSLGSDLTNAIINSIKTGSNAWAEFKNAGSKAIETLGQQLVYELFLATKFQKLGEDLKNALGAGDPKAVADEQMRILTEFYNNIGVDMAAAEEFARQWQEQAKKAGFNIWGSESPSTLAGALKGASQESIDLLAGQTNAVRVNQMESIEILRQQLIQIILINVNFATSNQYLQSIDSKLSAKNEARALGLQNI